MKSKKSKSKKQGPPPTATKGASEKRASPKKKLHSGETSPPRESWFLILALSTFIGAFFAFLSPENPWLFLSSHYLYFGWLVFVGLAFSSRTFYLSALGIFLLYPAAIFVFRFNQAGSILPLVKYTALPLLDMAGVFGLLYLFRRKNKLAFEKAKEEKKAQEEEIERLKQKLQRERVKSGNLERNIRNQEYTFTLVYQLFKSFLDGTQSFETVLRHNLARLTKAQKLTIFYVNGNKLVELPSDKKAPAQKIDLEHDAFLKAVCRLQRILTVPEIARSPNLYQLWKRSGHRGLIFIPILVKRQLRYLISIDQMPFYLFHSRTVQALHSLVQMAEFSQKILAQRQEINQSTQPLWRQELRTPQLFLGALKHEFQRAQRFQSSFSLIGIHIRLHEDFAEEDVRGAIAHYIRSEIRELDQFFFDHPRQIMWIILPFTGFPEMSLVLNRIDEKLSRLEERPFKDASFDYGFSIFESELESPKSMLKQVVEVMQIHNKILQKMSRRHAYI